MDAVRETTTLIAADKVKGTDVFNNGGDRLGSVHDLMIDKQTGQVAYAILSFGRIPRSWKLVSSAAVVAVEIQHESRRLYRRDRRERASGRAFLSGRHRSRLGRSRI